MTDTNDDDPNVDKTEITAALAISNLSASIIDPDISIKITTFLVPAAAETYHGLNIGWCFVFK